MNMSIQMNRQIDVSGAPTIDLGVAFAEMVALEDGIVGDMTVHMECPTKIRAFLVWMAVSWRWLWLFRLMRRYVTIKTLPNYS